jgi:hypothetical protein
MTCESLQHWDRFLDAVKATAAKMLADRKPASAEDEALIIRNCARMLRHSMEWEMEATDRRLPHLVSWEGPALTACPPGPNMDSPYLLARLDPQLTYRLSGRTDGLFDINLQIRPDFPPRSYEVVGDLGFRDLQIVDGRWELYLAPREVPGNKTLIIPKGNNPHIFFRSYWIDWTHSVRPQIELECLDAPLEGSRSFTPQILGEQLQRTAEYLDLREKFQHDWFVGFMKESAAGGRPTAGGPKYLRYGGEYYDLAADQALVMEFHAPKARLWNVHLYDASVYDTFDWYMSITSRNMTQCHIPANGRIQLVIANSDPGVQNWLDSGGSPHGILFYRWMWSEDSPPVGIRKLPFAQLGSVLASDTPSFSRTERAAELKYRRRKLQHHFFW